MTVNHSFSLWLGKELATAQDALLSLYEEIEKMIAIDGARLRQTYLANFGALETQVMQAELSACLLQKKLELARVYINRRQKIDWDAIEGQIDLERKRMLAEADQGEASAKNAIPQLTAEEEAELQGLYHKVIADFHPQTNPAMTSTQKELFEKATQAYRERNTEELRLILKMLGDSAQWVHLELSMNLNISFDSDLSGDILKIEELLHEDYTLAAKIYPMLQHTEQEEQLIETTRKYQAMLQEQKERAARLQTQFPFSAREMLNEPQKINDYRDELTFRLKIAQREQEELQRLLDQMTKEAL